MDLWASLIYFSNMQDQFKKLITLKDDPSLAVFDELLELNENIGKVIKSIEENKVTEVSVTNQESVDFTSLETGLTSLKESIDNIVIPEIKGVDLSGVETLLKKISEKKEDKIDLSSLSELKNIATILDGILFAYQNMCQMKMPEMKEVDMSPLTEILTLINDNIISIEVPEFEYERIIKAIEKIKINVGGTSVAGVEALLATRSDMECGGIASVGTTAVNMTFTGTTTAITITALQSNTGLIYIGKSNVTSAGANAMAVLYAGESLSIDYDDVTNAVYAVSDTASQSVVKGALL